MSNEATNEAAAVEPQASPEVEVTEEMIRELAAKADGIPFKSPEKANIEAGSTPDQPTSGASEKPEGEDSENKDSVESAESPKSKQTETKERNASEASEAKPDKTAREQARLAESWKRLEAEKAQVRSLQAELQKMKEEAERASDPLAPSKPEELRQFARKWEDEGRDDLAKAARQQAEILEKRIKDQAENQEKATREFRENWDANIRRVVSENPELEDRESNLGQKVQYILNNEDPEVRRLIHSSPNGIIYAAQIAKMMEAAEASEALRSEVESLRKENTELRKKTSLSASGSQAPAKRKSFEEMSYQEQEEFLRRNANDADRFGVLIGE